MIRAALVGALVAVLFVLGYQSRRVQESPQHCPVTRAGYVHGVIVHPAALHVARKVRT